MAESTKVDASTSASNIIVGEGNTVYIIRGDTADEEENIIQVLPQLSTLPGRPFHECLERTQDVKKMVLLFQEMEKENQACLTCIYLTGPPGSGKTQLARQFGRAFLDVDLSQHDYDPVVLTINVKSIENLMKSVKEIVIQLQRSKTDIIASEKEQMRIAQWYMEELRKMLLKYPGKWLLILDNMFSVSDFKGVLPSPGWEDWGNGKVIITTQNSDIASTCHQFARVFPLRQGLDEQDAVQLLETISGVEKDEAAVSLARSLEFLPLSLACVATYVRQMRSDRPSRHFTWKDLADLYEEKKGALTYRTFTQNNVYPQSMVVAAHLATKRLAEYSEVLRYAFVFLSYCSINPMPLAIVSNFVQASHSTDAIMDEIKAEISRCSLLSDATSSFQNVESIKFHQVMGGAFSQFREERASMQNFSSDERRNEYVSLLYSLIHSLDKAIPDYDRRSVALKVLASPHLKKILKYGEEEEWTECPEYVVILAFLADCLYHVPGVTEDERISHSENAYKLAHCLAEPMKSIWYCKVLKTLGFYYRESGKLEKAVEVLQEGLHLASDEEAKEWIALRASLLNVLSWTYKLQMKYDLAEEKMNESISFAVQSFGKEHEEIVERLCNLAIIHREKQDINKAKDVADEARRIAAISTDEWHLTRAQAANFSAKIYLRYAEMTEGEELKKQVLDDSLKLHGEALNIYEKVLGNNHIYVAGVCMTYAIVYKELLQYSSARQYVERAEKIYRNVKHIVLASALRYKTEVLLALDEANEAERAIKESMEIENCGRARFLLSDVLLHQKRYEESRAIIKEVLDRWKSGVLPPTHFWVQHAEKIKYKCECEMLKQRIMRLLPIAVLLLSVFLGIVYSLSY